MHCPARKYLYYYMNNMYISFTVNVFITKIMCAISTLTLISLFTVHLNMIEVTFSLCGFYDFFFNFYS